MFIKKIIFLLFISLFAIVPCTYAKPINDSLNHLIAQAQPGQTVIVPSGTYHGPIVINKPIVLRASPGVILEGDGTGSVLTIAADDVAVEGFTIRGSGQNRSAYDAGVQVQGERAVIKKNQIEHTLFGIHLNRSFASQIIANRIVGSEGAPVAQRGNGIQITGGGGHMIEHNHFSAVQDGVYFDQTTYNTVRHNVVERSRYGYHVMFSDHTRIIENETKNSVIGAMIMAASDVVVQDNLFHNQTDVQGCGLFLYDVQGCKAQGNQLVNNTTGIAMDMVQNTAVERNTVAHNAVGVKRVGEVEAIHLRENVFAGNVRQVGGDANWLVDVWSRDSVGNYWDDYKGWDFNKDGIGDGAYRMADDMVKVFEAHPLLGIFYAGPMHQLMDQITADYPIFDKHPLMTPPAADDRF